MPWIMPRNKNLCSGLDQTQGNYSWHYSWHYSWQDFGVYFGVCFGMSMQLCGHGVLWGGWKGGWGGMHLGLTGERRASWGGMHLGLTRGERLAGARMGLAGARMGEAQLGAIVHQSRCSGIETFPELREINKLSNKIHHTINWAKNGYGLYMIRHWQYYMSLGMHI